MKRTRLVNFAPAAALFLALATCGCGPKAQSSSNPNQGGDENSQPSSGTTKPAPEPSGSQKLAGNWTITSSEKGGEKKSEDALMSKDVTMTDKTLTFGGGPFTFVMDYTIDASKTPHQMTLTMKGSAFGGEGTKAMGIINFSGDTMQLCYAEPGAPIPKEFSSPAGSRNRNLTLRRAK